MNRSTRSDSGQSSRKRSWRSCAIGRAVGSDPGPIHAPSSPAAVPAVPARHGGRVEIHGRSSRIRGDRPPGSSGHTACPGTSPISAITARSATETSPARSGCSKRTTSQCRSAKHLAAAMTRTGWRCRPSGSASKRSPGDGSSSIGCFASALQNSPGRQGQCGKIETEMTPADAQIRRVMNPGEPR